MAVIVVADVIVVFLNTTVISYVIGELCVIGVVCVIGMFPVVEVVSANGGIRL